jgi:hypothetical protein
MNIEKAKETLQAKGYCNFDLKEFDEEFYKYLEQFKCTADKNLKEHMNNLRLDANLNNTNLQINERFETFDLAKQKADEILNQSKLNLWQVWYFKPLYELDKRSVDDIEYIRNAFIKVISYLYDLNDLEKISASLEFTYYDIDGMIEPHKDAPEHYSDRLCNILIYLNETYDDNDGGLLVLNDEIKVSPTFGNVAVIDLKKFNTKHEVTKVTNGMGRYALLSFIGLKD